MNHIRRQLSPGETLLYRARYHWWRNLRSFCLPNLFTEIAVTDRRVIRKTGILAVDVQSLPVHIIEQRDVHQTLAGRILGYGDVQLHGIGGQSETFSEIARPIAFLQQIDRAIAGHEHAHGEGRR